MGSGYCHFFFCRHCDPLCDEVRTSYFIYLWRTFCFRLSASFGMAFLRLQIITENNVGFNINCAFIVCLPTREQFIPNGRVFLVYGNLLPIKKAEKFLSFFVFILKGINSILLLHRKFCTVLQLQI